MEEQSLLKERLQAITDKRKIREDISRKRREIEEEKLKLQYIKKKSLREQWLMDGLQSEEEQEAMKVQAQDELHRTDQLQTNILQIEKEIEELEAQELNISTNEEAVLKRLKEVERTTEDIIKELSTDVYPDLTPRSESSLSDIFIEPTQTASPPARDRGPQEPKKATFAMEISVELDKRTGKAQVISTATVTPDFLHGKGLKVYEDGRKSVYALPPGGGEGEVTEMSSCDVEELLRQASDWKSDVHYHQPVFSTSYTCTSRSSTPCTSSRTTSPTTKRNKSQTPSPAPSRLEVYQEEKEEASNNIPSINVESPHNTKFFKMSSDASPTKQVQNNSEASPHLTPHRFETDYERSTNLNKTFYIELSQSEIPSPKQEEIEQSNQGMAVKSQIPQHNIDVQKVKDLHPFLVSVKASLEGMPTPIQMVDKDIDTCPPQSTLIKKSMNIDKTPPSQTNSSKILTRSKMTLPISSHGGSKMKGSEKEVKLLNNAPQNINKNQDMGEMPIQAVCSNLNTNSLRSTHRYELALIERSMNLDEASYSDSIKTSSPTLGESMMDEMQSNRILTKGLSQTAHINTPSSYNIKNDSKETLLSLRESSEVMPTNPDSTSSTCSESAPNSLVDEPELGTVTMIFMGYEQADEDEQDSIQAEVVVIEDIDEDDLEDSLFFHPNGYTSKVFQPTVGIAMVTSCGDYSEALQWGELLPHKPTFMHRSGRNSISLQEQA